MQSDLGLCCECMPKRHLFPWCGSHILVTMLKQSCKKGIVFWNTSVLFPKIFEPERKKTYLPACAPCKNSDQPVHLPCLIRIITGHIFYRQGCKLSLYWQQRLWSDCTNAKPNWSLCWVHKSEGTFSALCFISSLCNIYIEFLISPCQFC